MTTVIIPSIISSAFTKARVSTENVNAASQIQYTDDVYQELIDIKKDINEDWIRDTKFQDLTPYKNEFTLDASVEKIKMLAIKYSVPTYNAWTVWNVYAVWDRVTNSWKAYICNTANTAWATFAWDVAKWTQLREWYVPAMPRTVDFDNPEDFNNQWNSSPSYFFFNNKVRIYPRAKESVVEWIKFDFIPSQDTLTLLTDDALLQIEPKLQTAWILWVAALYRDHIWDKDGYMDLKYKYEEAKQQCMDARKDRHFWPLQEELPLSLTRYMR